MASLDIFTVTETPRDNRGEVESGNPLPLSGTGLVLGSLSLMDRVITWPVELTMGQRSLPSESGILFPCGSVICLGVTGEACQGLLSWSALPLLSGTWWSWVVTK